MDEEMTQDEEGRARLKLKVENTIRWRYGIDKETGQPKKESNARVVRWSDGSLSLHLGSEIFDVHKQPLQSDFNHLFIRQVCPHQDLPAYFSVQEFLIQCFRVSGYRVAGPSSLQDQTVI